jgi:hypothetical protein
MQWNPNDFDASMQEDKLDLPGKSVKKENIRIIPDYYFDFGLFPLDCKLRYEVSISFISGRDNLFYF